MTPRQIALALVPPVCFGAGFTLAKPAMTHFPPLFTMLVSYGVIAIALALFRREPLRTPIWAMTLIAALAVTIQGALLFWGLAGMPAISANLILQIQVPFAIFFGWLVAGDRPDFRILAGTMIAIAGVVAVIGLPEAPPPMGSTLLVIAGALSWSLGQVLSQKLGRDGGVGQLQCNAYAGVPQLILATVLLEHGQIAAVESATPVQWAMLGFVAFIGFGLAYATWYSALKVAPIDEVAPFMLVMPVVGIATAWALLGEPITAVQIFGGVVILLGLALVSGVGQSRRGLEPARQE